MGRPPCCDKIGVKKGPWTPEEDIILVSYIQENGPGNWRTVPTNTGLLRCSKSCRLRWTNYLRPGIKRGNFTDQEENLIIHLQALLGNRWAAIASYLPERTDNDVKNYWNTHLKKKLRKIQVENGGGCDHGSMSNSNNGFSKGQWERRLQTDIHMAKQALCEALSMDNKIIPTTTFTTSISDLKPTSTAGISSTSTSSSSSSSATYASSTENISRLLEGWMRNPPKPVTAGATTSSMQQHSDSSSSEATENQMLFYTPEFSEMSVIQEESKSDDLFHSHHQQVPLSVLEKWLFDESCGQVSLENTDDLF